MKERRGATEFGKEIRKRLVDLDMDQTDLARQIGTSKAMITHIIYGDRSPEKWKAIICETLNLPRKSGEKGA